MTIKHIARIEAAGNEPYQVGVRVDRDGATMSSLEIAELTGKRHDHVMADIRKILGELHSEEDAPTFRGIYRDAYGREKPCFNLPHRELMVLLTGYSIPLRAKVIDRWEELEQQVQQDPIAALSDPAHLRTVLLSYTEKVLALESENAELSGVVDRIVRADGSLCITDAAKALQMRPSDLFSYLRGNGWIYRRPGAGHDLGYQAKVAANLLEHKVTTVLRADGSEKVTEQVRVTPKGLTKLAQLIQPALALA